MSDNSCTDRIVINWCEIIRQEKDSDGPSKWRLFITCRLYSPFRTYSFRWNCHFCILFTSTHMVIPALALGTILDLIGAVKVYMDQIAEFDDVVEETKEVLALLEPAVLEALNTNSTGEGGALHAHFTSLDERLKGFHDTLMKISKRPCFIRFFVTPIFPASWNLA